MKVYFLCATLNIKVTYYQLRWQTYIQPIFSLQRSLWLHNFYFFIYTFSFFWNHHFFASKLSFHSSTFWFVTMIIYLTVIFLHGAIFNHQYLCKFWKQILFSTRKAPNLCVYLAFSACVSSSNLLCLQIRKLRVYVFIWSPVFW